MGSAIAGFLPSFVLPVTGLKNSVFISAFLNIIAFWLAAMSLEYDNIILTLARVRKWRVFFRKKKIF